MERESLISQFIQEGKRGIISAPPENTSEIITHYQIVTPAGRFHFKRAVAEVQADRPAGLPE